MAHFYTEAQVVEAARKAYREHAEFDAKMLKEWADGEAVAVSDWTDPHTELDQLGEALKDELAAVRSS